MDSITVVVHGTQTTIRALASLVEDAPKVVAGGILEHGERVMALSKEEYVPTDQGTLRGTGHVQPPKISGANVSVELGFGGPAAPYALAVHENPRAGKTGGVGPTTERMGVKSRKLLPRGVRYKTWAAVGQWKFLEVPFKLLAPDLLKRIAERVKREIQRRAAG